ERGPPLPGRQGVGGSNPPCSPLVLEFRISTRALRAPDRAAEADVVQVQSDPLPVRQGGWANCRRCGLIYTGLRAAYRSFYRSWLGESRCSDPLQDSDGCLLYGLGRVESPEVWAFESSR